MSRKIPVLSAIAVAITFCTTLTAQVADEWKIIHAGTLLADAREEVRTVQSIIVRNNQIVEVRDGYVTAAQVSGAASARMIDLKNQFVMPGLIDSHTHILSQQEANSREVRVTRSSEFSTLMGVEFGMRTLRAGFTSIRNVGADRNAIFALRDAINQGIVMGPRIKAAGRGVTPTGTGQQVTDEEQIALVQAAHAMGRKVAAHAHGKIGLEAALRAGVDSIEHGSYLDEETADLFVETGAYLVPTLIAGYTVERIATERPGFFIPAVRQKALEVGPVMRNALRIAYEKGVKIAFGTDAGVNDHGTNAYELVLMKQVGMPERAILISATINAADLMSLTDITGTIEAGKDADIIAASGNPLEDLSTLMHPTFVMARGNEVNLDVPPVDLFPWPNL